MARSRLFCSILVSSLAVFYFASCARADDGEVILPAGTLIRCTLDEPNFSTKTAEAGDPVICHLRQLLLFDRSVFPRGAYLGGHLEAAKEPGYVGADGATGVFGLGDIDWTETFQENAGNGLIVTPTPENESN